MVLSGWRTTLKRNLKTIYAIFCTLLLAVGFLAVFYFAWQDGVTSAVLSIAGLVLGFVFAPILHELGHVVFAKAAKMDCVFIKCFCFKLQVKDGKKRFSFASPFAPDRTEVIPKCGGNMKKRASAYTLGGLVFSAVLLSAVLTTALLLTTYKMPSYLVWGILPYAAYLFLLNVAPLEYGSGKTDMLVYYGICKGEPAEKNLLSAMEIQGRLYAGESFSEIEEDAYYDLPQLCEDEPLFAVMLDLRYRYHLEKAEYEKAADCLNRLALLQPYLSETEIKKIAAELTYMHSLNKDLERIAETSKICREVLLENTASAKRILAAYSYAIDKPEAVPTFKAQAEECLQKEKIKGLAKFERILLSRIAEE